jgi:hypothetical protein
LLGVLTHRIVDQGICVCFFCVCAQSQHISLFGEFLFDDVFSDLFLDENLELLTAGSSKY